jgi:hypothetical protein
MTKINKRNLKGISGSVTPDPPMNYGLRYQMCRPAHPENERQYPSGNRHSASVVADMAKRLCCCKRLAASFR